jgi:prophage regulatory protein
LSHDKGYSSHRMSQLALVSVHEIAAILGVSRQRVDQLSRTEAFPEPVALLAVGRIWLREDIEAWASATGRNPD